MGLLSKASEIKEPIYTLAFNKFLISHQIKTFAVFELINDTYIITNSIGFDYESIYSSSSTKDFWSSVCKKDEEVYSFSKENTNDNPLLQFFSYNIVDSVNNISVIKINNSIYMICNKSFDKDIINDIKLLDYDKIYLDCDCLNKKINNNCKTVNCSIDLSSSFNLIKNANDSNINNDILLKSLFNEMINRFSCFYCKGVTNKKNTYTINIVLVLYSNLKQIQLENHILYLIEKIIGDYSKEVKFNSFNENKTITDINEFLQVD